MFTAPAFTLKSGAAHRPAVRHEARAERENPATGDAARAVLAALDVVAAADAAALRASPLLAVSPERRPAPAPQPPLSAALEAASVEALQRVDRLLRGRAAASDWPLARLHLAHLLTVPAVHWAFLARVRGRGRLAAESEDAITDFYDHLAAAFPDAFTPHLDWEEADAPREAVAEAVRDAARAAFGGEARGAA